MDQESLVLEVDPRSVLAAIRQANQAVDDWEKGTVKAGDSMQRSLERMSEMLLKVNDRSHSSMERLTQSIEKQAAAYAKTGGERLLAERDRIIKKLGDEQAMIERVTKAYDSMMVAEGKRTAAAGPAAAEGGSGFNARYAMFGVKDVMEGRTKFAIAEAANELMRLRGAALVIGGVTLGIIGIGVAAYEIKQKLKELADEPARLAAEFSRLNDPLKTANDEMRVTNDKLENTIAKLENRPQNGVKLALDEAAVAADHLSAKMDKVLGGFAELLKKNQPGVFSRVLFRQSDDSDLEKLIGGESGFGGMRGALYAANGPGGDPDAVVSEYRTKAEQALRQAEYSKAVQERKPFEGQLRTGLTPPSGLSRPEMSTRQDSRIEKFKAFIAEIDQISDSQVQEKQNAALEKRKDVLEANAENARKSAEALIRFHHEAEAFSKKGDEVGMDPVEKIYYERDRLIEQAPKLKGIEADIAAIRKSADEQAAEATKKLVAERQKSFLELEAYEIKSHEAQSKRISMQFMPSKEQFKDWDEGFAAKDRIDDIGLQSRRDTLNRNAGHAQKLVQLSGDTGMDAVRATYQIRIDLAKELAAVEAERISKDGDGHKRSIEFAQAQRDLQKEFAEAQEEAAMKQLEIQKQQTDSLKRETEGLWNTLLTKPRQFGKQLGDTLHAAVLKPVTEGLASVTANVLKPVIYGQDGDGGVAGVFKGIFGGGKQDPVKLATDMNTAVTVQNSAALATLTAILAGAMGMSAPAIAAPGGIGGFSLPAISVTAPSVTVPPISFGGGGGSSDVYSLPTINRSAAINPLAGFGGGGSGGGSNPLAMIFGSGGGAQAGGSQSGGNHSAGLLGMLTGGGMSDIGPGGNPGFAPGGIGISGGSQRGSIGNAAGPLGVLKNLKGINWGGFTHSVGTQDGVNGQPGDTGHITGVNGAAGAALSGGGMMLAQSGLLGNARGTGTGIIEGAAGGAAVGMQMGGIMGASIGLWAGLGIGIGEMLFGVESPQNEAKRLVKQLYSVNIDTATAKQIVSIAQSKYAGHVSIAVRDPDVRKMLELYAQGTGQKMPMSATTPRGGSLAEQGGKLYQQASYVNGAAYTFQSSLPVLGGLNGGTYPTPGGPNSSGGMGPMSVSLNIGGADAASFFQGQVVTPQNIADQMTAAQNSSYARVQQAANMQVPGLVTGT